jgi:hypothetical protein
MIHCTPVEESERSPCSSGTAIATIVWSMKVIETARIIAARIRVLLAPVSSTAWRLPQAPRFLPPTGRKHAYTVGNRPVGGWFDRLPRLMPDVFWIGFGITAFCVLVGFLAGARSATTRTLTGVAIGAFLGLMAGFPLLAIGLATS